VVWRAGLDLHPLDVTDPADLAWLDALIWPEHSRRRARLKAAAAIAAADPPLLMRGDLLDDLPALAAQAPAGAAALARELGEPGGPVLLPGAIPLFKGEPSWAQGPSECPAHANCAHWAVVMIKF